MVSFMFLGAYPSRICQNLICLRASNTVGVMDADGRLVGLVTPEAVGEMMMINAARGGLTVRT